MAVQGLGRDPRDVEVEADVVEPSSRPSSPAARFAWRAACRLTHESTAWPAYRVTMLGTAPVLPSHGARSTKDRPCVREVRRWKTARWSEPMRCSFEVQTFGLPFTACWSWMRAAVAAGDVEDAGVVVAGLWRAASSRTPRRPRARRPGRWWPGWPRRAWQGPLRSRAPVVLESCASLPKVVAAPRGAARPLRLQQEWERLRDRSPDDRGRRSGHEVGTRSRSASQAVAAASLGIRQSPRGLIVPPALTFGPLGRALRLNWLAKKRRQNTSSQCRISPRSYAGRALGRVARRPLPRVGVVPGVPGQEGDLASAGSRGAARGRA